MISKEKKYKTRDGKEVKIYDTDGGDLHPVHGAILEDGKWVACQWTNKGEISYYDDSDYVDDLIEVKETQSFEFWVNMHKSRAFTFFLDGQMARDAAEEYDCIACLHFNREYEEGEGL